ncbi:MAG: hypothetical protein H7Z75_06610 [Ferruginibacter sp.]|nr:hypothetical protein [Cytophagales bacterium]
MTMGVQLTAVYEFLGESQFAGYVPALPEIPQVIGQGVTETKRRLEHQLQTHFGTNFFGQTYYITRTVLIFPTRDQDTPSASLPA